jgi:hypothetical protein
VELAWGGQPDLAIARFLVDEVADRGLRRLLEIGLVDVTMLAEAAAGRDVVAVLAAAHDRLGVVHPLARIPVALCGTMLAAVAVSAVTLGWRASPGSSCPETGRARCLPTVISSISACTVGLDARVQTAFSDDGDEPCLHRQMRPRRRAGYAVTAS